MTPRDALVLMAKYPEPGTVKTRLGLEPGAAAALQTAFLRDLTAAHRRQTYALLLAVAPAERSEELRRMLEAERAIGQRGEDLGARLEAAVADSLREHRRVAVIGSDLPTLGPETVFAALAELERSDVVLGPSEDGGYYLIALREPQPLFRGIPWSTGEVLRETRRRADEAGLRVALLETRRDIDTPEDLRAQLPELRALAATREVLESLRVGE